MTRTIKIGDTVYQLSQINSVQIVKGSPSWLTVIIVFFIALVVLGIGATLVSERFEKAGYAMFALVAALVFYCGSHIYTESRSKILKITMSNGELTGMKGTDIGEIEACYNLIIASIEQRK